MVFSTFHMDQLAKIHWNRWKELLKISKVAKFESNKMKLTKIWLPKVAKFYRRLYGGEGGGQVYAPPPTIQTSVKFRSKFTNFKTLFLAVSVNFRSLVSVTDQ